MAGVPVLPKIVVVRERSWCCEQYSPGHIMMRLSDIVEEGGNIEDHYDEFYDLQYWLTAERFNRKAANQRLYDYASGKEGVYMGIAIRR